MVEWLSNDQTQMKAEKYVGYDELLWSISEEQMTRQYSVIFNL